MDTELLRTFIEITRTKHFGRAAGNLYLTQSAVSARMRLLEETLGVRLLTRQRNDIQLTPAGRVLLEHATEIVDRWALARQAVAVRDEGRVAINLATIVTIDDILLPEWLVSYADEGLDVSLTVEVLEEATIYRRFEEGSLDIALLWDSSNDQRLRSREVGSVVLQRFARPEDTQAEDELSDTYTYVEWGTWFDIAHAKLFPNYLPGRLKVGSPRLAANVVARSGGSAFLPPAIGAAGGLAPVPGSSLERAYYALYPAESDRRGVIEELVNLVTRIAD